ncbi:ankyrin repeat-containing domain protein [Zopfochytrium polystomum]|nr:ankyrin repeat-containing domain protein [Zopfochytrium polystomum]
MREGDAGDEENDGSGGGLCALHWAADRGHAAVVRWLVERGATVDARDADEATPLHYAAIAESREAIDALLACGADRTAKNADGETPQDVAPALFTTP